MTVLLSHSDAYLREFDGTVVEKMPMGVVLDKTAFFPGGGGQPCDFGFFIQDKEKYVVTGIKRHEGKLVHLTDTNQLEEGQNVQGVIDWDHRYQLMRTHTALHILCGVVWRDFGALVTGGDMKPMAARMDFELEQMSADFARNIEVLVNDEIHAGRPIVIKTLPRDEALKIPDLIRTKINLLPEAIKEIRVVDIVGLDLQADGGTHVGNTREVGIVRVVKHESKGRINKRLRVELD